MLIYEFLRLHTLFFFFATDLIASLFDDKVETRPSSIGWSRLLNILRRVPLGSET